MTMIGKLGMKKMAAGSFKIHCLAVMDEVQAKRETVVITKHGKPAAVVVPVEEAKRLYPTERPSFAALLMAIPHAVETERDTSPLREADL